MAGVGGRAATDRGAEAAFKNATTGPAHHQAAHWASNITEGGGPQPRTASIGRRVTPGQRGYVLLHHPGDHTTAVEHHTHLRADPDTVVQRTRDRVVERLSDSCDVGQHANDSLYRHRLYRPSALFKSSTLGVASQVNSLSLRPKWPYAAVRR